MPRNLCGRARALLTLSAAGPVAAFMLSAGFLFARSRVIARLYTPRALPALQMIHFARWALVRELPGSPPRRLATPYLLFETNFNGSFEQYIDAFAYVLTSRIANIWRWSYGFPGPKPAGPFKRYIERQQFEADLYHCAYPEATAADVTAALELSALLDRFAAAERRLGPDGFAARYERFTTEAQRLL